MNETPESKEIGELERRVRQMLGLPVEAKSEPEPCAKLGEGSPLDQGDLEAKPRKKEVKK